ncbi:unnamed protein product [Thelazia callipaeda]|uniref:RB_B domain-containing protein n=1 Tax=Thelazia callipaeda TaxID=103827 RepID=A0A0N5D489_THECL|nr:unnamed protein product [Thelazia callipaeda]
MHTISLLQYERKMNSYGVTMGPPPTVPPINRKSIRLSNSQDMANEFSEDSIQSLLTKAIAVLAAHLGFVIGTKFRLEMESSVLSLLSRIVAIRMKRMCNNLKLSQRRRVECRETAFPSALMHALRLENISNVTELHDFYRDRIILYHEQTLLSCVKKYEKATTRFDHSQKNDHSACV